MTKEPESTSTGATTTQLNEELSQGLSVADSVVAGSIKTLQLVQQARISQLLRTSASLKAKFGDNDPRVQTAQAAVSTVTAAASRVGMVSQQLATPPPQVSTGGWALHGRVFHSDLTPAARYTVFLVDAQKSYQKQYGFAYTDETGYFEINFAGRTTKSAAAAQLFMEVVDQKAEPVYLSATPFQPAIGSDTYENITLPQGEKPLGDPPPEIRKVAFPDEDQK